MHGIDMVGYAIREDAQYKSLRVDRHSALGYWVVFPTAEDAEEEISRIFERERRRIENSFRAQQPHPGVAKRAWDDHIGTCAMIEERISDWRIEWNRDKVPGRSALSSATVFVDIEQRVAWRAVKMATRMSDSGPEAIYEIGEPGQWSEWHTPIGGSNTYIPHLHLEVVPFSFKMIASQKDARSWLKKQIEKAAENG